jgi:hypothetical protein
LFVANLDLANLEITSTSARRRVPRWLREVGVEYDARRAWTEVPWNRARRAQSARPQARRGDEARVAPFKEAPRRLRSRSPVQRDRVHGTSVWSAAAVAAPSRSRGASTAPTIASGPTTPASRRLPRSTRR